VQKPQSSTTFHSKENHERNCTSTNQPVPSRTVRQPSHAQNRHTHRHTSRHRPIHSQHSHTRNSNRRMEQRTMTNETKRQGLEMGLSWLRVFVAAVLAQFLAGVTDPSILINAGAAAVIPIILRWLDVDDKVYGRGTK
jgi:hypothetical protein